MWMIMTLENINKTPIAISRECTLVINSCFA